MKSKTKKWIYRISFIGVIILLYFFQWRIAGWDSLSLIRPEREVGIGLKVLYNFLSLGNYAIQLGLPFFLLWKGFLINYPHKK